MADYNIVVRIDPSKAKSGAKDVNNALNDVGNNADRVRNLIGKMFAFVGVAAAVRKLVELADTFTNIQNRLGTVTKSTEELSLVTEGLFGISNRTRQSFESTAEVYARIGLAAKDLGVSQQQLLEFTESLNQAVALSGASATEASAGLIQLSQGLASGALRGDELRSVLEQLPAVADVIAKSMNITRGQLREMGAQGKITADIVLNAFQKARVELQEKFAKTVPTIGQSFVVLRNNVVGLIGSFNKSSGASTTLAKAILSIADNVEPLARAVAAVAITLGTVFAVQAVGKAISAIKLLTTAMIANPFTALAVAITAVVATLITFGDQITLVSGSAATAFDLIAVVWGHVVDTISAGVDLILPMLGSFGDYLADFDFMSFANGAASAIDAVVGFFIGAYKSIMAIWDKFPAAFVGFILDALNTVLGKIDDFIMGVAVALNKLPGVAIEATHGMIPQLTNPFADAGTDLGKAVSEGFASGLTFSGAQTALTGVMAEAEQRALERQAKEKAAQEELLKVQGALGTAGQRNAALDSAGKGKKTTDRTALLQRELQLLDEEAQKLQLVGDARDVLAAKMQMEEKIRSALRQGNKDLTEEQINNLARLTDAESQVLEAATLRNLELKREADILDEINGPAQTYEQNIKAINELMDKGKISVDDYNKKLVEFRISALQNSTDIASGLERGLLSMKEQYTDLASTAEKAVTDAFQGMEDALVTFVTTGKLSFSDLINTMMEDITRLAVQQAIMQPLTEALASIGSSAGSASSSSSSGGSWISSALSGLGSLLGFADGGSMMIGGTPGVDRNVLSLNDKPVAKVSRGETLTVSPQGTGGSTNLVFNISTPDANSFQRSQGQIMARAQAQMSRAQRRNS